MLLIPLGPLSWECEVWVMGGRGVVWTPEFVNSLGEARPDSILPLGKLSSGQQNKERKFNQAALGHE